MTRQFVTLYKLCLARDVFCKSSLSTRYKSAMFRRKILIGWSTGFLAKVQEGRSWDNCPDISKQEKPGTTVIDPANDIMSCELMILDIKDAKKQ